MNCHFDREESEALLASRSGTMIKIRDHQSRRKGAHMNETKEATTTLVETAKTGYVIAILVTLGFFAAGSALLIAWPALAYLGSKVM
jgi:hypothetical protein